MKKLNELESKDLANAIENYLTKRFAQIGDTSLYNGATRAHLTKLVRKYGYSGWMIGFTMGDAEISEILDELEIY